MDSQLIQRTRYVLKNRFEYVDSCPTNMFSIACKQLLNWLKSHFILSSIIDFLSTQNQASKSILETIVNDSYSAGGSFDPGSYEAETIIDHIAICFHAFCVISEVNDEVGGHKEIKRFVVKYLTGKDHRKESEVITSELRKIVIQGLHKFLDEELDGKYALHGVLQKYRKSCEWFHKSHLRSIIKGNGDGKTGEKSLAYNLYEYIFNQGIEFFIEPTSPSGEIDIILRGNDGSYICIDAKYIKKNANRSEINTKLSHGFHQVFRYCEDYNEQFGFLVTFIETKKRILLPLKELDNLQYLSIGSKVIFYFPILISDELSASKSGKAEEVSFEYEKLITEL